MLKHLNFTDRGDILGEFALNDKTDNISGSSYNLIQGFRQFCHSLASNNIKSRFRDEYSASKAIINAGRATL